MNALAGNAPAIRTRICEGLGFPGVQLDENRNAVGEPLISADQGHVQVRAIRTDDDVIIAKAVFRMLADAQTRQRHVKDMARSQRPSHSGTRPEDLEMTNYDKALAVHSKVLPVSITKEQVKNIPHIDTDKPVSRQHEMCYLGYYGYPSYWGGAGLWGGGVYPGKVLTGYDGIPAAPNFAVAIAA